MGLFKRRDALPPLPQVAPDVPDTDPVRGGINAALAELELHDPGFTLEGFLEEALQVFLETKEAYWSQDLEAIRLRASGPALERMVYQARLLSSRHQRYDVAGLEVLSHTLERAPDDLEAIELVVRFHFRTESERTVHPRTGAVFVDHGGSHHSEDWVFVRSERGAWVLHRISVLS